MMPHYCYTATQILGILGFLMPFVWQVKAMVHYNPDEHIGKRYKQIFGSNGRN